MRGAETFLITVQFDAENFRWLQELRNLHFPPTRNHVPAHLTLLHTVSRDQVTRLVRTWGEFGQLEAPVIYFTGVKSLGCGTAFVVESPLLVGIRSGLMHIMGEPFTRQDRQSFRPHVTIQNKVSAETASALFEQLSAVFVARQGLGRGLIVWRYLGGPWALETVLKFKSEDQDIASGEGPGP